jgi:hypothetical protein
MSSCLSCQAQGGCELASAPDDHYEMHVTVESADVDAFRCACAVIGVKPILLDLHLTKGGIMKDLMTSSRFRGSYAGARARLDEIAAQLTEQGYKVVRKKLETTPWNEEAKARHLGYFESHLPVETTPEGVDGLREIARRIKAHVSRNAFKANEGTVVMMTTIREHGFTAEAFAARVDEAAGTLRAAGFVVGKVISEFAAFDTNVDHDAAWTEKAE